MKAIYEDVYINFIVWRDRSLHVWTNILWGRVTCQYASEKEHGRYLTRMEYAATAVPSWSFCISLIGGYPAKTGLYIKYNPPKTGVYINWSV